ncbi:MAG: hypothetical protein Q8N07_02435, partial [Rhodocyclaceae bacterium]|nr:hypothetical protein [Rhodocyclaceae bacterium]
MSDYLSSYGSKARQGPSIVAMTIAFCTSIRVPISDRLEKRRRGRGEETLGTLTPPNWPTAILGDAAGAGTSINSSGNSSRGHLCASFFS